MRKTLTLILGVALFGILTAVVVASQGADDPVGTGTTTTTERTTTTEDNPNRVGKDDNAAGDISGPCDEAEHANDPRCNGQAPAAGDDQAPAQGGGVDISGPCDEAEHAGDPRCTGAPTGGGTTDDDRGGDNSGPGSSNSGPGSANSGRDDDRGEVEAGDDRGDDNEAEVGDDHGGHDELETGDDHRGGGNSGPGGGGNSGSGSN
jgi:hypothetical protein